MGITRLVRYATAASALCVAEPSLAADPPAVSTGNELLVTCTDREDDARFWTCYGFLTGVLDGMMVAQVIHPQAKAPYCTPVNATNGQIKDVVVQHLRTDPAHRHLDASILVVGALAKAFPCPQK